MRLRKSVFEVLVVGLALASGGASAFAESSGDVVCAGAGTHIVKCTHADGTVFAHAVTDTLNGAHWVDITIYDDAKCPPTLPGELSGVRCHVNIQWAGDGESFRALPPMAYPSHDVPSEPTLIQLLCYCK